MHQWPTPHNPVRELFHFTWEKNMLGETSIYTQILQIRRFQTKSFNSDQGAHSTSGSCLPPPPVSSTDFPDLLSPQEVFFN